MATKPKPEQSEQIAFNLDTVAARLTVSTRHLRRLIRTGELPAKRIGARVIVLARDLDAYLQQLPSAQTTA
jgi:excisionase family DNA binding protein